MNQPDHVGEAKRQVAELSRPADWRDLQRRLHRRRLRRRTSAVALGSLVGALAVVVAVAGPLSPFRRSPLGVSSGSGELPEGNLIVRIGSDLESLSAGSSVLKTLVSTSSLPDKAQVVAYDLSPDGRTLLATEGSQ